MAAYEYSFRAENLWSGSDGAYRLDVRGFNLMLDELSAAGWRVHTVSTDLISDTTGLPTAFVLFERPAPMPRHG